MKKTNTFTIVELLVVIAVIAILSALLLPALGKARSMANRIACVSQMKQCVTAHFVYSDDYGNYLFGWRQDYPSSLSSWQQLYISYKYLPNHTVMVCPETRRLYKPHGKDPDVPSLYGYGIFSPLLDGSYMVSRKADWGDFYSQSCIYAPYTIIFDTRMMRRPSATFLLMDSVGYTVDDNLPNWCFGPLHWKYMASFWHPGCTVAAYMDGHVEPRDVGALREMGFTKLYRNGVAMDIQ